jgi:hypothetical protein
MGNNFNLIYCQAGSTRATQNLPKEPDSSRSWVLLFGHLLPAVSKKLQFFNGDELIEGTGKLFFKQ